MPGFPPVSYIKPVHSQVQPYDLLLLQTGLCFPAMQTQSHAVLFQCFFFLFGSARDRTQGLAYAEHVH